MVLNRLCLVMLLLGLVWATAAQQQALSFHLVESGDKQSLGKVTSITQDKHGYIWLASEVAHALIRYDGNQFKWFRKEDGNPNSLGSSAVFQVHADPTGAIWIGYHDHGLDRFDPLTGQFMHFNHDPRNPASLSNEYVSTILWDSKNRLWVGTDSGLNLLDVQTGKFRRFFSLPDDSRTLSDNHINLVYEDQQGVIWVGTGFPWFNRIRSGGLNRLEEDGSFTRFGHDPHNPSSLSNNVVYSMFEDSRGVFWVGTGGREGLHTMDRKTGKFTRYPYDANHPDALSRPPLEERPFERTNSIITCFQEDQAGGILIGTMFSGITRYDPATNKVTRYNSSNGYQDSSAWTTYRSRDGVIWLANEQAKLYRVESAPNQFRHVFASDQSMSYYKDTQRNLWVGTLEGGLMRFDSAYHLMQVFKYDPGDPHSLFDSRNIVANLYPDRPGHLLIATTMGPGLFDLSTNRFKRLKPDSAREAAFWSGGVYDFIKDKDGTIWIATYGNGLVKFNPSNGSTLQYQFRKEDTTTIQSQYVVKVIKAQNGDIWTAGTSPGGVSRLDQNSGKFRRYLKGIATYTVFLDSRGAIWAGTDLGLFQFDPVKDQFIRFSDPFAEYNQSRIHGITEDKENMIWVSRINSLVRIHPITGECLVFELPLLQAMMLSNTIFVDTNGDVLVSHPQHGFLVLEKKYTQNRGFPFEIRVNALEINNEPFITGPGNAFTKHVGITDSLVLPYDRNNLSIQFSSNDYREPESIRYYTMLENYDNTWRRAIGEKTAQYFLVPDGNYLFRVKAFNKFGQVAERKLYIRITPPWWRTGWAYAFYAILFLLLLYLADRMLKQRIIRREREKAHVIELAQAREIEKAYHELRATQTQLLHAEKMASLGELTAGIAHEIQNPLNFVNNFAELNTELSGEIADAAKQGDLEAVQQLAEDIKANQEKIQLHGKRAESIVKSMLQHARTGPVQKELTDLNALCDECLRLSFHGLRAKDKSFQAAFEFHADSSLPRIELAPQEIGRTLLNLLNNAFQAVQEKSTLAGKDYKPLVTVTTTNNGNEVEIRVADNGPGIPEAIRQKIFQPFFTTKATGQGTGLGLSLSNDLVRANGGTLTLEKSDEQGSRFLVSLPTTKG